MLWTATTYVAGDTVWCPEVAHTLRHFRPAVAIVNAGAAHMIDGGPVTMTGEDVCTTAMAVPGMRVVVVHMDAADLVTLSRVQLLALLREHEMGDRVYVPADGEELAFVAGDPPR